MRLVRRVLPAGAVPEGGLFADLGAPSVLPAASHSCLGRSALSDPSGLSGLCGPRGFSALGGPSAQPQPAAASALASASTLSRAELAPHLGSRPRLSLGPQLVAGLLPPGVDWAAVQRGADGALRQARPPKGAKGFHSHIKWPAVRAGAQLRPSQRFKAASPPAAPPAGASQLTLMRTVAGAAQPGNGVSGTVSRDDDDQ